MTEFIFEHPDVAKAWYHESNYLALLVTDDEAALIKLVKKARIRGVKVSVFHEPDIGNEITAIALEPGRESRRLCKNLNLALR